MESVKKFDIVGASLKGAMWLATALTVISGLTVLLTFYFMYVGSDNFLGIHPIYGMMLSLFGGAAVALSFAKIADTLKDVI